MKRVNFKTYFIDNFSNIHDKYTVKYFLIYMTYNLRRKNFKIYKNLYGDNLSEPLNEVEIKNKPNFYYFNLLEETEQLLENIEDKVMYGEDCFACYFIGNFINKNTEEEEILLIKDAIDYFLNKTKMQDIDLLKELYGENLDQFISIIDLDTTKKGKINTILFNIRKAIKLRIKYQKENIYSRVYNIYSMYDYLVDMFADKDMNELEKEDLLFNIRTIFCERCKSSYKYVLTDMFGETLAKKRKNIELTHDESMELIYIIQFIKQCLDNEKKAYHVLLRDYFIDSFVDIETSEEEKEEILEYIRIIFVDIRSKYKYLIMKIYGEYLDQKRADIKISPKEQEGIRYVIKCIKKELTNVKKIKRVSVQNDSSKLTKLDYIIYELLNADNYDNNIDINYFIDNNNRINDKVALLKLILKYKPSYLIKLFNYEPYKTYFDSLNELDQYILSMKIVGLYNEQYTLEFISKFFNVSLEYVKSVRLSDEIEEFNIINEKFKELTY